MSAESENNDQDEPKRPKTPWGWAQEENGVWVKTWDTAHGTTQETWQEHEPTQDDVAERVPAHDEATSSGPAQEEAAVPEPTPEPTPDPALETFDDLLVFHTQD